MGRRIGLGPRPGKVEQRIDHRPYPREARHAAGDGVLRASAGRLLHERKGERDRGERAQHVVRDAPGELLQLFRLALDQPPVLLLQAEDVPDRASHQRRRDRREHRAQRVELQGETIGPLVHGLDAGGHFLGLARVRIEEVLRLGRGGIPKGQQLAHWRGLAVARRPVDSRVSP